MAPDLLEFVQSELSKRRDQWEQIAEETDVSHTIVYKLALRSYKSSPKFSTLAALNEWLRKHPRKNGVRAVPA